MISRRRDLRERQGTQILEHFDRFALVLLSLHAVHLSTVASVLVSLGFSPLPQRRVNFGTHTL